MNSTPPQFKLLRDCSRPISTCEPPSEDERTEAVELRRWLANLSATVHWQNALQKLILDHDGPIFFSTEAGMMIIIFALPQMPTLTKVMFA